MPKAKKEVDYYALAKERDFEWLGPMFNEQMHLQDGRMHVSDRHGLGFSLSEQAISWRADSETFGKAS